MSQNPNCLGLLVENLKYYLNALNNSVISLTSSVFNGLFYNHTRAPLRRVLVISNDRFYIYVCTVCALPEKSDVEESHTSLKWNHSYK